MELVSIKLNSAGDQTQVLTVLKNAGFEVIQASDGLIAKGKMTEVKKELGEFASQMTLTDLDPNDPDLPKDAKVLAGVQ